MTAESRTLTSIIINRTVAIHWWISLPSRIGRAFILMSVEDHLVPFIASSWYSVPVPQVKRITSKLDPFAVSHLVFNNTVGSLKDL